MFLQSLRLCNCDVSRQILCFLLCFKKVINVCYSFIAKETHLVKRGESGTYWLDYMYDSFLLYPLSFKTSFSVHNFKNMPSVLLVLSFVWFFLKFDLLLCTTTHPVQISDSIRKIFSTMTIWVSLFLTKARLTEKEKGCIIIWLFSIFKFNFLKFFDYISSFNTEKSVFFCKNGFSSQILKFAHCEEIFTGLNCRNFWLCFILARFRNCFLKLTAVFL